MKKICLFLMLIPYLGFTQKDTLRNPNGQIFSVNQTGINKLISNYKKYLSSRNGIEGWRLQIKFTSKREDILKHKMQFMKLFPEIPVEIIFDSPYYKLTAGNYRTKNGALKVKNKIKNYFPGSHPITSIFDPNLLKH